MHIGVPSSLMTTRVGHIMTPRADLTVIDTEVDPAVTLELLKQSDYTRYPVVRGDVSNVVGVIDSGDLLAHYLKKRQADAREGAQGCGIHSRDSVGAGSTGDLQAHPRITRFCG